MSGRSLTQRSVSAAAWSLAFQFIGRLITPVIGILLARRLSPADYGLIGMLGIFWAVGAIFTDGGFGIALLRKKDPEPIEYDSVFCYNLALSFLIYLMLFVTAPWIAAFYRQPLLESIVRVTALTFPIGAWGAIPTIILQKRLQHRVLSGSRIGIAILSGLLAIGLAYGGYGVWALVWQQVVGTLLGSVFLIFYVRWLPSFRFHWAALKQLMGFGSRMLASNVLNTVFANLYQVAIGRFHSPEQLGYYTRANAYAGLWPMSISGTVESVTLPAFAEIQEDRKRLGLAVRRSLILLTAVCAFPTLLIAVLARPLIVLLLTERWAPLAPFMWWLAGVHVLLPFHTANVQVLTACGRSDLFLRIEILKKLLIALNLVLTVQYGVPAMVAGQLVVSLLSIPINGFYSARLLLYSLGQQFSDLVRVLLPALLAACLAGAAHALFFFYAWPAIGALGTAAALGTAFYLLLLFYRRAEELKIAMEILSQRYPDNSLLRWFRTRWHD